MTDKDNINEDSMEQDNVACESRRTFLMAAKNWSKAVVAGAVFGSILLEDDDAKAGAWANRRGGGRGAWANRRGGGRGAWGNGGGRAWGNGRTGAWGNGRGTWANRQGGGSWANR